MNIKHKISIFSVVTFVLTCGGVVSSCANKGIGPQGGPKDETPPSVVKETPQNGAVNYNGKRIEVLFNEYIQLDKVSDNVLISPPQQRPPEVKAYGKKLIVAFDEDLRDSTTYTIDFGAAICDNNEKNPLEGYSFSFATGDVIDSLELSGLLLNAEDLNPVSGIVVGIHENLDDSALTSVPFTRIGKTDSDGFFTIRNIHQGRYRLYALGDVSKDYIYQTGEGLALYDSVISPVCHTEIFPDTIWKDSVTIDTIMQVSTLVCEPENITLLYFKENKQRRYFQRAIREHPHFFSLYFAAPQDSLPQLLLLHNAETDTTKHATDTCGVQISDIAFCQTNMTNDTITYWLIDSTYISQDTLLFQMRYQKTDSLFQLDWQTDTIKAIYRAPRISEKAKARMEKLKQTPHVDISGNGKSPFEIYAPLTINTATPLKSFQADSIHFYEMLNDTVSQLLKFELTPVDSSYMHWQILHDWKPETSYQIQIDSAALTDIYGFVNLKYNSKFKTRTLDEYSSIIVKVEPFDSCAMIQILDDKDKPILTRRALPDGVKFNYLAPKSYYMRMYLDLNGDSVWTTGDFQTHRHPEPVYYFPSKLTLRANWDFEETFHYLEQPIEEQKPQEITKDASAKK